MTRHWIWIFGEIEGLRWVLERNRMAFAAHAARRLERMAPGDLAVLYTTRGAYHSPTYDEARLQGLVEVTTPPKKARPVTIAGRDFPFLVSFEPIILLPERQGAPVRPLGEKLGLVRRPEVWGQYFRTSPIEIEASDYRLLVRAIERHSEQFTGAAQ